MLRPVLVPLYTYRIAYTFPATAGVVQGIDVQSVILQPLSTEGPVGKGWSTGI